MSAIQAGATGDGIINFDLNGTLNMDANGTGVATISVAPAVIAVPAIPCEGAVPHAPDFFPSTE